MKKALSGLLLALLVVTGVRAAEPEGIRAEVLVRSGTSWDGTPLPAYPQERPEISILKITIPPGADLPIHRHPVINAGVLLAGELTVVTESNRTLHLKAGEAIVEVVDTWHSGRNTGTVPAQILVFYAGVRGGAITVRKKLGKSTDPSMTIAPDTTTDSFPTTG